ncbi:MAG TPA: radical SAM protein [Planctomycetota bacterium]|nr:radical SAM protein [Planctomycetota bacterium]
MTTLWDFLSIETRMEGDKIIATTGGRLAPAVEPFVNRFFSVLNSLKVIAKKDGANVYNLYNPPQPTEAGMRALERKVKEVVFNSIFPATANLAVTHKCQCKCRHCSAEPFVDPTREEVTTEEIKTVVDGALELGASLVIFTGGEPMLQPDLCELIDHVDKSKAMVMIFTNGQFLTQENVDRLARAGLTALNISIDHPDPEKHNAYRKVPGLWEKAMAGGQRALEAGILTGISTYATHETLADGSVERLVNIAIEHAFNEITIFDCIPSGRFLKHTELILTDDDRRKIIALYDKYHEGDYPIGVVAMCKVNSPEGAGCFGAHSQFYMTAYGDINPCDFNPISFGNIRDLPIQVIWGRMRSHPDFKPHHKTCRMQTPAYRAKYIDPLPDGIRLPVPIDMIDELAARAHQAETPADAAD